MRFSCLHLESSGIQVAPKATSDLTGSDTDFWRCISNSLKERGSTELHHHLHHHSSKRTCPRLRKHEGFQRRIQVVITKQPPCCGRIIGGSCKRRLLRSPRRQRQRWVNTSNYSIRDGIILLLIRNAKGYFNDRPFVLYMTHKVIYKPVLATFDKILRRNYLSNCI